MREPRCPKYFDFTGDRVNKQSMDLNLNGPLFEKKDSKC